VWSPANADPIRPAHNARSGCAVCAAALAFASFASDVTAPEIQRLVLDAAEGKRWVFYPGEAEARAWLETLRDHLDAADFAALEQEQRDQRRLDFALNAARAHARADRLWKIEKANARFRAGTTA
jgi:hypothetical protein